MRPGHAEPYIGSFRRLNIVFSDFHGEKAIEPRHVQGKLLGGSAHRVTAVRHFLGLVNHDSERVNSRAKRVDLKGGEELFHDHAVLFNGDLRAPGSDGLAACRVLVKELNRYGTKNSPVRFCPGDHDLELGVRHFRKMMRGFKGKIYSANVRSRDKWYSRNVRPFGHEEIKPWGIRIGYIGLTNPIRGRRAPGFEFLDPVETYDKMMKELKRYNVDIVYVLGHVSAGIQRRIAEEPIFLGKGPKAPVIYGGHTHRQIEGRLLGDPPALLVEPGMPHGTRMILVDGEIDSETRAVNSFSKLVEVNAAELKPDPIQLQLVESYLAHR